jgi:hypothetical protein
VYALVASRITYDASNLAQPHLDPHPPEAEHFHSGDSTALGMLMKYFIIAALAGLSMVAAPAVARHTYGGYRVHYSGSHHTSSHGGHYVGGSGGSSHRGGHYSNPRTGNHYGCHKCR